MRIALLADLHGNWPATQALERDLIKRGADKLYCLGDMVGKGPSNDKTYDWAMANCDLVLGGNWDYGIGRKQFAPDAFYWNQLGPARLSALAALPLEKTITLSGRRIRLFHGRPIMNELLTIASDAALIDPFFTNAEGERCDVIGFADAHRQMMRTMNPGLFFNCGSVGNAMGNPLVCYAILEGEPDDPAAALDIRLVTLPYDRAQAVRDAEKTPELPRVECFIREVQTGIYSRSMPGSCKG